MNKQEWYLEFQKHLLEDEKPSKYFNQLVEDKAFPQESPFKMIKDLKKAEQEPKHHPEGNAWNHTMEVVDLAAKYCKYSHDDKVFMWSALLHDLGKAKTTKRRNGRLTAYDHDKVGAKLVVDFFNEFNVEEEFADHVIQMVRWHMQPMFVYKDMPYARIEEMVENTSVSEVGLLSLCDRSGRGPLTKDQEKDVKNVIRGFLVKSERKVVDQEEKDRIREVLDILG